MIFGVGVDLVHIARIERILQKEKDRFLDRICAENEIKTIKSLSENKQANALAKLFSAKEAVSKAFGTGIRDGINFKDIEVEKNKLGKPSIVLHGTTKDYFDTNIKGRINISLADEDDLAFAFVVISVD